ncbi:MAG TPA: hypothetical protein VKF40_18830 [Burkholderiales bacterium]|nr:hypothetical protein [Burkholderiales bacterium]
MQKRLGSRRQTARAFLLQQSAIRHQRDEHDAGPSRRLFLQCIELEQAVVVPHRYDSGVGSIVVVALDVVLAVRMSMVADVVMIVSIMMLMTVLMYRSTVVTVRRDTGTATIVAAIVDFDVEMRRSAHIQIHRSEHLKRHEGRQKPGNRRA